MKNVKITSKKKKVSPKKVGTSDEDSTGIIHCKIQKRGGF